MRKGRRSSFDFLRLVFATLVLLSHAFEIRDGNRSRELLSRLTHVDITFGEVGVQGFFLLSGYLILQSWHRAPILGDFLRNRVLRIFPALACALTVSYLAVGTLAPGAPHFFSAFRLDPLRLHFTRPPVLPGLALPYVNGSLWTIPYELICYGLVAIFGVCGVIRSRIAWLLITASLIALQVSHFTHFLPAATETLLFDRSVRTGAAFFAGGSFYFFRHDLNCRRTVAWISTATMVAALFSTGFAQSGLQICGGYLMFVALPPDLGHKWIKQIPDISYGVYLYGWPIEALWAWFVPSGPWTIFLICAPIAAVAGWLSWKLIERPALSYKKAGPAMRTGVSL